MNTKSLKLAALTFVAMSLLWAVPSEAQEEARASRSAEDLNYQQALQRGTQAVIWGMPAVGIMGIRRGSERDLGATFNDIIYMSHPPAPRQALLTPTNQTPYVIVMLNTGDGPVVLDLPRASEKTIFFGTVIDAWQLPVTDVGPEGADEGDGGKYLFLPPGYDKPVPEGYIVFRPKTYHLYVALRPVSIQGWHPGRSRGLLQAAEGIPAIASRHAAAGPLHRRLAQELEHPAPVRSELSTPLIRESEAASVAQHVRMGEQGQARRLAARSQERVDGGSAERLVVLTQKERLAERFHPGAFF